MKPPTFWRRVVAAGSCAFGSSLPALGVLTDVTRQTGLESVHAVEGQVPLSEVIRAGRVARTVASNQAAAAAFDANGDGWTDLITARYGRAPGLFLGQGDGTFREATGHGLESALNAAAFGAGDFDNDGDTDLFIARHRAPRFYFYLNDGSGRLTEAAVARGADVLTTLEPHEAYSIGLVDYNRDGFLDIYVSEWGVRSTSEDPLHSVLLRNRGAAQPAHFDNVTAAAGLVQPRPGRGEHYGFASAWADFDDDGWPDLALVGDFGASRMYWNQGDGTFVDGTTAAGFGRDEFGMGVAVADYDADGRLDLYVTSIFEEFFHSRSGTHHGNKLYRNLGGRKFAEVAAAAGVDRTGWGWGAAFFDYENDGDADLLVANGMDAAELGPAGPFVGALSDPTTLLRQDAPGRFINATAVSGLTDTAQAKAVVILDYDQDGDEDAVITNTFGPLVVYRNNANTTAHRWVRFRLQGTASARDAIGTVVRVTSGDRTQTLLFNPSNAYLGQREPVLHAGLGAASETVAVQITWPSGAVQALPALADNQTHLLVEPPALQSAPLIRTQPLGGTFLKGSSIKLSVAADAQPAAVYRWTKDGSLLPAITGPQLELHRVHPADAGTYQVTALNPLGQAISSEAVVVVTLDAAQHSLARWWNEALLDAIRLDRPNPPVHARNLYHLSAALWDAYWAYHDEGWSQAVPIFHREQIPVGSRTPGDQARAISHAAYQVLRARFHNSPGSARSQLAFRWLMEQLGADPDDHGIAGLSAAAVGNRIGLALLAACRDDGANEAAGYADLTGYTPRNAPLIVALPGTVMAEPNYWQPLALRHSIAQNGIVTGEAVQPFVGINGGQTTPFALIAASTGVLGFDPGPPPQLGTATAGEFVRQAVEVIRLSSALDPANSTVVDVSPGARFNNHLGRNDGKGHPLNPFTASAYGPHIVRLGDFGRVLAEYWADGPESETPPGHWNLVLNEVSDDPRFTRRYGGVGPMLSALEWDIRAYVALNGAVHDAACAAWGLKHRYDSARPISMIRHLGGLGQSTDPQAASYHPEGLPLEPGLIELVTPASAAAGERHAHLVEAIGQVAIRAWRGSPADPTKEASGVGWVLAEKWVPYQQDTFVSPAFPGYVSGHSTFSRAAAEVLTLLTGSAYFPGGVATRKFAANQFLSFEPGPSADVELQWATYYDAADQAGLSRLYGGIHIAADDLQGRKVGARVGFDAFVKAHHLRSAAAAPAGLRNLSARARAGSGTEVLITGFVLAGPAPQPVLMRSLGPALRAIGLADAEVNPRLELRQAGSEAVFAAIDDWNDDPSAARIQHLSTRAGALPLSPDSGDAALVRDLPAGAYTSVTLAARPDQGGLLLTEVFADRLANFSARGRVGTGDDILIVGFMLDTADTGLVLLRAVGPSLAAFGVPATLGDPGIEVYHHHGDGRIERVARNNDWSEPTLASQVALAADLAGAFPLAEGSRDAALLLNLPRGRYTMHVHGGEGVVLAELYLVR